MKIFRINLKKHFAKVMPESLDDLWHLYNIILKRDEVYARTTRQTKPDDQYSRPTKAKRIPVNLGVQVEKMYWDKVLNRLRINGIVCDAPEKLNIKGRLQKLNSKKYYNSFTITNKGQKYLLKKRIKIFRIPIFFCFLLFIMLFIFLWKFVI